MAQGVNLCAICVLCGTILVAASAKAIDESLPPGVEKFEESASYASLSVNIAYLKKLKADEQFLAIGQASEPEQRAAIVSHYEAAKAEIDCGGMADASKTTTAAIRLLCADIEYRKLLAHQGLRFWGGVATLIPEIPPVHLRRLRSLLVSFEKLADEIAASQGRGEDQSVDRAQLNAEGQRTLADANGARERVKGAQIQLGQAATRSGQFQSRIGGLEAQRAMLFKSEQQARAELNAASAAFTEATGAAAMAALGAPPWLTEIAKGGSPEAALKGALLDVVGSKLLADEEFKAQLDGALSKVGTSTTQIVELYNDVKAAEEQVNRYGNDLRRLEAVLRQPTLDGLLEVGAVAWQALDENEKQVWREQILAAQPVLQTIALMNQPNALAERLKGGAVNWLASQPGFAEWLRTTAKTYLSSRVAEAAELYKGLLTRLATIELDDGQARLVVESVFRTAGGSLVAAMPPQVRADLRRHAGVLTDLELERYLAREGLRRLPQIVVENGSIAITASDGTIHTRPIVEILDLPNGAVPTVVAELELERLLAVVGEREDELRAALVELLPVEQVAAGLDQAFGRIGNDAEKINAAWERIVVTTGARNDVAERVATLQVGTAYADQWLAAQAQEGADVAASTALPGEPRPTKSPVDPAAQVALLALDAAFPGAGTALKFAGSLVEGVATIDAALDHLLTVQAQLGENFADEARTRDLKQEADNAVELALKEADYYQAIDDGYREAYTSLKAGLEQLTAAERRNGDRLERRGPLTFYYAERLRENFDQLDRSLALWAGFRASPRGAIAQLIRENPQNVRLAIDSEIHLFDFLDRSGEGMRTEPDRLLLHWRQLAALAEDACQTIGCEGSTGGAQVRETALLSVCALLRPEDRRRLRAWQERPQGRLALDFYASPERLGFAPDHRNHRLIDVRLGGIGAKAPVCSDPRSVLPEDASLLRLGQAQLTHPGIAYVQQGDGGAVKETFLLRRTGSLALPIPFDLAALRGRWSNGAAPQRLLLEGYGLVTTWRLELEPEDGVEALSDIGVRFAYQYNDPQNIITEREFVAGGAAVAIDPFEFTFSWDEPSPQGLDEQGRPVVTRQVAAGSLPVEPVLVAQMGGVDEILRARHEDNGLGLTSSANPLVQADFRLERRCRNTTELTALVTEQRRIKLAAAEEMLDLPVEYRNRRIERRLARDRQSIAEAVRTLQEKEDCNVPVTLVGAP